MKQKKNTFLCVYFDIFNARKGSLCKRHCQAPAFIIFGCDVMQCFYRSDKVPG